MSEECALGCGKPVNPHDVGTWKEVVGWVGGPRKDSMRLRQDTGRYAHDACVAKLQAGQAIDQPELLSVPTFADPDAVIEVPKEVEDFFDED